MNNIFSKVIVTIVVLLLTGYVGYLYGIERAERNSKNNEAVPRHYDFDKLKQSCEALPGLDGIKATWSDEKHECSEIKIKAELDIKTWCAQNDGEYIDMNYCPPGKSCLLMLKPDVCRFPI